ncbi:hypothetical protein FOFC_18288 [Fusarium oxysporum]|nr:hypothetical protein FOFC_18288 [Fusarium oxysporum]
MSNDPLQKLNTNLGCLESNSVEDGILDFDGSATDFKFVWDKFANLAVEASQRYTLQLAVDELLKPKNKSYHSRRLAEFTHFVYPLPLRDETRVEERSKSKKQKSQEQCEKEAARNDEIRQKFKDVRFDEAVLIGIAFRTQQDLTQADDVKLDYICKHAKALVRIKRLTPHLIQERFFDAIKKGNEDLPTGKQMFIDAIQQMLIDATNTEENIPTLGQWYSHQEFESDTHRAAIFQIESHKALASLIENLISIDDLAWVTTSADEKRSTVTFYPPRTISKTLSDLQEGIPQDPNSETLASKELRFAAETHESLNVLNEYPTLICSRATLWVKEQPGQDTDLFLSFGLNKTWPSHDHQTLSYVESQ